MAKIATINDSFNDGTINVIWGQQTGLETESGGNLVLPILSGTTTDRGIYRTAYDDAEDSFAHVKIIDAGSQVGSARFHPLSIEFFDSGDNNLGVLRWAITIGLIVASVIDNFGNENAIYFTGYNTTVHKWVRIREASGTTYFGYSTNGYSWTTAGSLASPFDMTRAVAHVDAFTIADPGPAYNVKVDNYNVLASAVSVSGDSTATANGYATYFASITAQGDSIATARASNFSQPQAIDRKKYMYKIYSPSGTFLGLWSDVISEFTYSQEINSAGSAIEVELARNSDTLFISLSEITTEGGVILTTEDDNPLVVTIQSGNQIGEGSNVDLNLRVDVYVFYGQQGILGTESGEEILTESGVEILADKGAPNGRRIFTGYISRYVSRYGSTETTRVTILSFGDELDNYVIEDSGDTTVPYLSQDPGSIVRDILDKYSSDGGVVDYTNSTVSITATTVTYTFRVNTTLEGIKKSLELAPSNWFWYVDMGQSLVYFQPRQTHAQHTFLLGKHIESLNLERHIEDLTNIIYFSGGDTGGGENLFKKYQNATSITNYRRGLQRISDNRVTLESSANIISESELERLSQPRYRSSVVILDKVYDLEDINLGDMIQFRNFGNFVDSLLLQIVSIDYSPDKVRLQLDSLLPSVNKRVADIKRNLDTVNTQFNPDAPDT